MLSCAHTPRPPASRTRRRTAGPGGGNADKPVGLVHFVAASRGGKLTHTEQRYGDIGRIGVRRQSVLQALMMLKGMAEN